MKKISLIHILLLFCHVVAIGRSVVTPEMYGAVGDGIQDDTEAVRSSFESGSPVILDKTYLITESLFIKTDIQGKGCILFGHNDVSLYCTSVGISIKGLIFNYQQHEGKLMRLKDAHNVLIEDCAFLNVGNHSAKQSEGMILITNGSSNITIRGCRFIQCYSSSESSSAGIWVNFSKQEDCCHHINITDCYFDDFQPSKDADAIKIIGQNENVYVYISNCVFHRCDKRALKLQARECHSKGNVVYVSRPMYCAIDFQRGYGTSDKDIVIIQYDGISQINPNSGLLYRAICIAQNNVTVNKCKVLATNAIDNNHQVSICLQSFTDYDDGTVSDVSLNKCTFDGQNAFITCSESVTSISSIRINRCRYNSKKINRKIVRIENQCKESLRKYLEI